ncbi:hypothetical protein BGZ99_000673 [Dissophora globulifera]|uniref:C2H2-type domain-containing protein n=1 Tax=Dissophora globulifera TaxID=979702 RepID=A0A9P6R2L7_9FUNG|nr:hypothetical protein BGZ99_000673 [Dissophora globulifera]
MRPKPPILTEDACRYINSILMSSRVAAATGLRLLHDACPPRQVPCSLDICHKRILSKASLLTHLRTVHLTKYWIGTVDSGSAVAIESSTDGDSDNNSDATVVTDLTTEIPVYLPRAGSQFVSPCNVRFHSTDTMTKHFKSCGMCPGIIISISSGSQPMTNILFYVNTEESSLRPPAAVLAEIKQQEQQQQSNDGFRRHNSPQNELIRQIAILYWKAYKEFLTATVPGPFAFSIPTSEDAGQLWLPTYSDILDYIDTFVAETAALVTASASTDLPQALDKFITNNQLQAQLQAQSLNDLGNSLAAAYSSHEQRTIEALAGMNKRLASDFMSVAEGRKLQRLIAKSHRALEERLERLEELVDPEKDVEEEGVEENAEEDLESDMGEGVVEDVGEGVEKNAEEDVGEGVEKDVEEDVGEDGEEGVEDDMETDVEECGQE